MELEKKKKYRKGEQRSDSADKERRQGRGVAVSFGGGGVVEVVGGGGRRMGGGGDVCIQLRADSSYANTANFLFYFISGAEICDLR